MIDEEDIQDFVSNCEIILKQKLCCSAMQSLQGLMIYYVGFADKRIKDMLGCYPGFLNFSWDCSIVGVNCSCLSVRGLNITYVIKRVSEGDPVKIDYFWTKSFSATSLSEVFSLVKPRLKNLLRKLKLFNRSKTSRK